MTTGLLSDVMRETGKVEKADCMIPPLYRAIKCYLCGEYSCECTPPEFAELVAEPEQDLRPDTILLEISEERFNTLSRTEAHDKGSYNGAYLANKLSLSPEGLDALAEYFQATASDLRERGMRAKADRLRAQTDTWREAGCPGQYPSAVSAAKPQTKHHSVAELKSLFE